MARAPLEVLKITEEKVLPLSRHLQMVRVAPSFMFFKDYKQEVLSPNSFESQLCGTQRTHTLFGKNRAQSSRCCGLAFTQIKNIEVCKELQYDEIRQ